MRLFICVGCCSVLDAYMTKARAQSEQEHTMWCSRSTFVLAYSRQDYKQSFSVEPTKAIMFAYRKIDMLRLGGVHGGNTADRLWFLRLVRGWCVFSAVLN